MSEKKESLFIFHVFRKDGGSLILHPFSTPEKLMQNLESYTVMGRYGEEPRVEALTLLKNDFYRLIETGVKNWVSDMRFIPKFLISACAFLVVYFFLTFIIRDPLPVVDEIAVSLAVSLLTYILIGRRDIKSNMAAKKRLDLRTSVDRISFIESPFVKLLEDKLHENESVTLEEKVQKILTPGDRQEFSASEREEAKQFVRVCEVMFRLQNVKKDEKQLKKFLEKTEKEQKIQEIQRWAESRKIDFPLYAVYKNFKRTVVELK